MNYLSTEAFFDMYEELASNLKSEFFKLEVLQEYTEFEISSWDDLDNEVFSDKILQVQNSILSQKELFKGEIEKGIVSNRIRYVSFPLTKYVLFEFNAYLIATEIGENIYIIDSKSIIEDIDGKYFCDYLMFDNERILIHDYDNGILKGAYYSEDKNEIAPYLEVKNKLEKKGIPFMQYIDLLNLNIRRLI